MTLARKARMCRTEQCSVGIVLLPDRALLCPTFLIIQRCAFAPPLRGSIVRTVPFTFAAVIASRAIRAGPIILRRRTWSATPAIISTAFVSTAPVPFARPVAGRSFARRAKCGSL